MSQRSVLLIMVLVSVSSNFGCTSQLEENAIDETISELSGMIPTDKILTRLTILYILDWNVRRAYNYLQSEELGNDVQKVINEQKTTQLLTLLKENGLDVEKYVHAAEANLKAPGATYGLGKSLSNATSGDLLTKILQNDLPLGRIQKHFREKLQRDHTLHLIMQNLYSNRVIQLADDVTKLSSYKILLEKLKAYDIDLQKHINVFVELFRL